MRKLVGGGLLCRAVEAEGERGMVGATGPRGMAIEVRRGGGGIWESDRKFRACSARRTRWDGEG